MSLPQWVQVWDRNFAKNKLLVVRAGSPHVGAVSDIQKAFNGFQTKGQYFPINAWPRPARLAVDGSFGNATYNAVYGFQNRFRGVCQTSYGNNCPTQDGIVGPQTWKLLDTYIKKLWKGGNGWVDGWWM